MSKTERFIQGQGSLDGTCFLYSLANATQCLTGKRVSNARWAKLARIVYNAQDYLANRVGTSNTDDNSALQEALAQQYLDILSPNVKLRATTIHSVRDGSNPERHLTDRSVLVVQNGEHWFCLLDVSDNEAYVACSWVWQRDLQAYSEKISPMLHRTYNDRFSVKDIIFFGSRAILVSINET